MQSTTQANIAPSSDEEKVHYWNSADIMLIIGMCLDFHGEQQVINGVLETEEERDVRLRAMLRRCIARLIKKPYRPNDQINTAERKQEANTRASHIATLHRLKNHPRIIEKCQKVIEEYKAEVALYEAGQAKELMAASG